MTIPANTTAEVWLPAGSRAVDAPGRATLLRTEDGHPVYAVPSGRFSFSARTP